jgi:hypothetical protein
VLVKFKLHNKEGDNNSKISISNGTDHESWFFVDSFSNLTGSLKISHKAGTHGYLIILNFLKEKIWNQIFF